MTSSTAAVIALFLQYKYPALVVLAFFEGPYVMMMSGLLVKLGVLALIPAFHRTLRSAISWETSRGTTSAIFSGTDLHAGSGKFLISARRASRTRKKFFSKHRKKILLGSKVTAGFGLSLSTLITAGMVSAPFGEFVFLNFFGQLAWTSIMLAVGYFFGNLYIVINNVGGRIFIIIAALVVIYLLLRLVRRLGRRAKEGLADKK